MTLMTTAWINPLAPLEEIVRQIANPIEPVDADLKALIEAARNAGDDEQDV